MGACTGSGKIFYYEVTNSVYYEVTSSAYSLNSLLFASGQFNRPSVTILPLKILVRMYKFTHKMTSKEEALFRRFMLCFPTKIKAISMLTLLRSLRHVLSSSLITFLSHFPTPMSPSLTSPPNSLPLSLLYRLLSMTFTLTVCSTCCTQEPILIKRYLP